MGKWQNIYQSLENNGVDVAKQLEGTMWMNRFIPTFQKERGNMLDLGCGMGADMLRCSELGFTPYGLDLEQKAVNFVNETYGFETKQHDFGEPLPFDDETFALVLSRFALHYLNTEHASKMFCEIRRVLKPEGQLLFLVNSDTHRELGLQYDYTDAVEIEPNFWNLPNDMNRTFLFYTTKLAKELLGQGWTWHYLQEEVFEHWSIEKRVILGFAEKS